MEGTLATFRMRDGSGAITLRYLVEDVDRHGNVRLYVRRPGTPKVRLHEMPGTDAFLAEYRQAFQSSAAAKATKAPTGTVPASLRWLCEQYFASPEFKTLEASTRTVRRRILEALCSRTKGESQVRTGDKPYAMVEPRHVRKWRDEKADTPHAANVLVKVIRQLFNYACAAEHTDRNPARDVPMISAASDGHHAWSLEEVQQFEERHPIGSKARLAMALLLYTSQRRSDVVTIGPQHARGGWITLTQQKNRKRAPVTLSIPIRPELQAVLDATTCGHLAYLVTEYGKPFTPAGFGNWFRDRCDEAGLDHCSAHGLRKAAASRLAELGATEKEIMAVTGHQSMQEVTRYTKAARQKVLAERAMALLDAERGSNKSVPLSDAVTRSGTKSHRKALK